MRSRPSGHAVERTKSCLTQGKMSQANESCDDFLAAVPSAGQSVAGGKTGKHAEHVRCDAESLFGECFLSRSCHPFQYLSRNVASAGITGADTFRDLGIKDSHSAQPPDGDRIGGPESNEDAYKLVDRLGWVGLVEHFRHESHVAATGEVVIQGF